MGNSLVLVVPGLLALPAPLLAGVRSLRMLARYAEPPRCEPRGIAAALFATLGMAPSTPVAPLALLGAGGDPGDDYVLCADPVHLAAHRDTALLMQTIDDLSPDDAGTLVRMLDRHFADDDVRFEALRASAWFARRRQPADLITTTPEAARGGRLVTNLPRGRDSATWKRWHNEIEMLLYEHPVNAARERRGSVAVNALWFWGGGRMADVAFVPGTAASAPPTRLGDVARGMARSAGRECTSAHVDPAQLMAGAESLPADVAGTQHFGVAVLAPGGDELRALEAAWLAPANELLANHRIDVLHVVADGNGAASTWTAHAPTRWQRIAARASRRAFEVAPGGDG
jgi:hypothetical protein